MSVRRRVFHVEQFGFVGVFHVEQFGISHLDASWYDHSLPMEDSLLGGWIMAGV